MSTRGLVSQRGLGPVLRSAVCSTGLSSSFEFNAFIADREGWLGLSSEQREHYGDRTFVAANVILDDDDPQIGVLAVSCHDDSDFSSSDGAEKFELLASDMGILIGDGGPADSYKAPE
jgi:hypothetical protein